MAPEWLSRASPWFRQQAQKDITTHIQQIQQQAYLPLTLFNHLAKSSFVIDQLNFCDIHISWDTFFLFNHIYMLDWNPFKDLVWLIFLILHTHYNVRTKFSHLPSFCDNLVNSQDILALIPLAYLMWSSVTQWLAFFFKLFQAFCDSCGLLEVENLWTYKHVLWKGSTNGYLRFRHLKL